MTATKTFKYQPLEPPTQIRIVVLHPGTGDDPIECSLIHTNQGERPYDSLSYEWGLSRSDDPIIHVDGCYVRVRSNLYDAFIQIRNEKAGPTHVDRCLKYQSNKHRRKKSSGTDDEDNIQELVKCRLLAWSAKR
jgi:hypothetical protein